MSTSATLLTICPFALAKELDILSYAPEHYVGVQDTDEILTEFGAVESRHHYMDMCSVLGVEPFAPGKQEITLQNFPTESLAAIFSYGDAQYAEMQETYERVAELLRNNCRVFLKVDF
jgi:elongation factor P--beta-lysine ligase